MPETRLRCPRPVPVNRAMAINAYIPMERASGAWPRVLVPLMVGELLSFPPTELFIGVRVRPYLVALSRLWVGRFRAEPMYWTPCALSDV